MHFINMYSVAGSCPARPSTPNSYIQYGNGSPVNRRYPIVASAWYRCNSGFYPTGRTLSWCRSDGWRDPPVKCEG